MRRRVPTFVGIAVAVVHVTLILRAAMRHTGGEFGYAVDDAYIELALAKHIAFEGVYAVTGHAFAAASSSVLWPWLLAGAMRLFGDQVTLPLFMNLAASIGLVVLVGRALEREASMSPTVQTLVVVAIVLLVPLATLTVLGMEHVLQAALTTAFVLEAARVIDDDVRVRDAWPLVLFASALVGTRYEGVFPVAIAVAILAMRTGFGLAAAVAAGGAAPIVLAGAYSVAHGSPFFPNSVELKRQHLKLEDLSDFGDLLGGNVLNTMSAQSYLLPLGFVTCALLAAELWRRRAWTRNATRLILALGTTIAHVELAGLGCFFRYEAYLVALDLTVIALAMAPVTSPFSLRAAWHHSPFALLACGAAVAVGAAPLAVRALSAQGATPMACANIHDQQVQTARFLARYFPHDLVAVNDIGAVAYYGDEPILDLEGLASLPVAKAKSFRLEKPLDAKQLASFTTDAPVAVIYDEWFPRVPTSWVRLGRLHIDSNKVCASSTVAVYATSGERVPRVLEALRTFGPSLPADVRRAGVWVEAPPPQEGARARWGADTWDVLSVEVAGVPEMTSVPTVDDFGSIWLPKVGEVRIRGMSLAEIAEAIRRTAAREGVALPANADVRVTLVDERRCRVLVAGHVAHTLNEPVDCGTPVATMLARAGSGNVRGVEAYIWRQDGGAVRRIALDYDPASHAAARAVAVRGGDIVIVE